MFIRDGKEITRDGDLFTCQWIIWQTLNLRNHITTKNEGEECFEQTFVLYDTVLYSG